MVWKFEVAHQKVRYISRIPGLELLALHFYKFSFQTQHNKHLTSQQ